MSQMRCPCGHIIRDTTDGLPYKADIIASQAWPQFIESLADEIGQYIDAVTDGRLGKWLNLRLWEGYTDWDKFDSADTSIIIGDLLRTHLADYTTLVYECENCGRILIQSIEDRSRYRSFLPEGPNTKRLLNSRKAVREPEDAEEG